MFKIFAILLGFTACTLIGCYQSAQLSRRRKLLTEYRDLLQRLETEMGYFKEPLPIIFQKLQQGGNNPAAILLRQCYLQTQKGIKPISQAWEEGITAAYAGEPLKREDFAVISKCGTFIGQGDYHSQKGHFSLLRQELERRIEDAEAACKSKGPLYRKAGISIGAVLAIALL